MLRAQWDGFYNKPARCAERGATLTNKLAIILALAIAGVLAWDFILNDHKMSFFLAQKFVDLIEWLAIWR